MTKANCKRCKCEIPIPDLSEEQKLEIWMLVRQRNLLAINKIQEYGNLNLAEAKALRLHINDHYKNCIRCNYAGLVGENIECPSCKGFNLNWMINQSFNEEFCLQLEYTLEEKFRGMNKEEINGYWCDGLMWDINNTKQLSKKSINDTRMIEGVAWVGNSGQERYDLVIKFGNQALKRVAKGKSLLDCIPDSDPNGWIEIDVVSKKLKIKLS